MIQLINLGVPNQGNGDTLRDAFDIVNQNFAEVTQRPKLPVYTSLPTHTIEEGEIAVAQNPTGAEWPDLPTGTHVVLYVNAMWTSLHTI